MARDLGSAFVTIKPDTAGFKETAQAKLKAAMAGINPEVPLGVNTLAANRNITALQLHLDAVTKRFRTIRIDVDDTAALRKMSAIDLLLRRINRAIVQPNIGLKGMDRILGELIAADKAMDDFGATTERATRRGAAAFGLMGLATGRFFGVFRALTGRVQLFGGALAGVPFLRSISGLHLLAESILEIGAVLIPATAAFLAFGVGAVGTVQDINRSMVALWNTTHALNQNIYPLTGNMQKLEDAVAPAVWNLFGQALEIINSNTAKFTTLAKGAAGVVEDLGARITVALTSGGVNRLMSSAVKDLAVLGDVFGNIFGTIANILRQMPGYAEVLLGILDKVTKAIEDFTGSSVGQGFIRLFLLFHGFIIWAGLAVTATVALGNAMVGLAAKFGLATEGALAFDAVQFGTGIKLMLSFLADTAVALVTFAGAEDIATASTGVLEGAILALDAINPLVWVGLAAAALGGLIYVMTRGIDTTNQYAAAAQKAFSTLPVSQLGVVLTLRQAEATATLAGSQKLATAGNKQAYDSLNQLLNGTHKLTKAQGEQLNSELQLYSTQADQRALLKTIKVDLSNYNTVLKAAGGNTGLLNEAGITSEKILSANKDQLAQLVVEAKAAADAQNALALGTGRAAAAQNAQTNLFLQETVPAMKKVTDAENNLLDVVISGEQAFSAFQQSIIGTSAKFKSPSGLADAAQLAGGNLQGLNEQSLAFVNTLYSVAIPNLQKMIVALDTQGASTAQVTTAVATGAGEILKYVGNNAAARAAIEALINNALGPGTVSLQSMDKWVKHNSTSLAGLSAIAAAATIHASKLAGVLHDELNAMLAQAALNALGGQKALDKFAAGVLSGDRSAQQLAADGGKKVLAMFEKMYQNDIPKAEKAFIDWAKNALGLGQDEALKLWKTLYTQLNPQIDYSGIAAKKAAEKIDASFIKSLKQIGFDTPTINADIKKFSDNILTSGDSNTKTAASRKKLIQDLINAGLSADRARQLVQNLQAQIDALHGKKAFVTVVLNGTGGLKATITGAFTANIPGYGQLNLRGMVHSMARGGKIMYGTSPTADDVLIRASRGETVVSAQMSRQMAPIFAAAGVPGYAKGGTIGPISIASDWTAARGSAFESAAGLAFAKAMVSAYQKATTAFTVPGAGGGTSANARLAQQLFPGVTLNPAIWNAWNYVAMRESGWSNTATNPTSGAFGIAQALPYSKYPKAGWPVWAGGSADPATQIIWMWQYMAARYGGPIGAAAHEQAFNWYRKGGIVADRGAVLHPGANLLYNKTGRMEPLVPAGAEVHVHVHNQGVIGSQHELQDWLVRSVNRAAKQGKLTYAIRRSPSA